MYQSVSESTPSVSKEGTYNLFFSPSESALFIVLLHSQHKKTE